MVTFDGAAREGNTAFPRVTITKKSHPAIERDKVRRTYNQLQGVKTQCGFEMLGGNTQSSKEVLSMKQDPKLVLFILEAIEQKPTSEPESISITGYTEDMVDEHLQMMKDDHLIEAIITKDETGTVVATFAERLTSAGHKFLKESREARKGHGKPDMVAKMLQSARSHPLTAVLIFLRIARHCNWQLN